MTTELLKQARDALAKSEPTGIYKYSMTAAKRHENLIKEIDAALAQPADEDALEQWARRSEALISIYVTALDEQDEDRTAAPEWAAVCDHLRTRPQQAGFVSVPVEPTEAMVNAYLKANSQYWSTVDHHLCGWMGLNGTTQQATAISYKAMIAAATKGDGK